MKFATLLIILLVSTSSKQLSAQLSADQLAFMEIQETIDNKSNSNKSAALTSTTTMTELNKQVAYKINYPASMLAYGIEGKSTVQLTISEGGQIEQYEILESLGTAFDVEIKKTLSQLSDISPILYDGIPKRQIIVLPIQFRL